jgi:NADH:ubiquinone oxidoreductase subunit E
METILTDSDVQKIVESYGKTKEYLIAVIQDVVTKKGYLTEELVRDIAVEMHISPNEVYSVATFYSFLNTKPTGKYAVRICKTISCDMAGKDEIISAMEKELGIQLGSTTDDKKFTLETTNCIGMCDQGPAMLINDQVYTKLNPQKAVEILKEYKNK